MKRMTKKQRYKKDKKQLKERIEQRKNKTKKIDIYKKSQKKYKKDKSKTNNFFYLKQ